MNLVGLMSLAPRIWKKDWLKLKSSFLRVNHHSIEQGPIHKRKEVFGRAQRPTRQIQSNLYFPVCFITLLSWKNECLDYCLNLISLVSFLPLKFYHDV